jgi:hypothetical protein
MRVFYVREDRRFHEVEGIHMLDTSESERLKVTALNLFHPTVSLPLRRVGSFILRHSLGRERGRVRGIIHFYSTLRSLTKQEKAR